MTRRPGRAAPGQPQPTQDCATREAEPPTAPSESVLDARLLLASGVVAVRKGQAAFARSGFQWLASCIMRSASMIASRVPAASSGSVGVLLADALSALARVAPSRMRAAQLPTTAANRSGDFASSPETASTLICNAVARRVSSFSRRLPT